MIKMTHALAVAATALAGMGMLGGVAMADSSSVKVPKGVHVDHAHDRITVVGDGVISAQPDVMRLTAGVEVRRESASEAFAAGRKAAAKLTEALVKAGVEAKDLRTNELSLGPEYENYPKVSGYRAAQGVEAVIRDLKRADQVIEAAAAVGEDVRLNGIAFEVSKPGKVLQDARARAFKDAEAKAKQYAKLAGRDLGQVISISEEVEGSPQPMMFAAAAMQDKGSVSPGSQNVSVNVRIVYGLD